MAKYKFLSVVLSLCLILSAFSISAFAKPTLDFGGFSYTNIEVYLSADVADKSVSEAMVYIYKNDGKMPSDDNPPIYMDVVPLTEGCFSDKTISLPLDFEYGDYVLAVYFEGEESPLVKEFTYYSPDGIVDARKQQILEEVQSAKDAEEIEKIFFDADSAGGVKLPENDIIINSSADFSVYETVEEKLEVFNRIIVKDRSKISDFDELIEVFEACAQEQKKAENRQAPSSSGGGGGDNTKPGGNKGNMVVSGGSSSGGAPVGGTASVFADMKGHWAEKYASVLSEKKVINGYADGSFKGENPVTRAELTKMLVSAFGIVANAGADFKDVDKAAWYYEFVAKASGAGIVTGYDGFFNPDSSVTRQDAALMLYRVLAGSGKLTDGSASFADSAFVSDYAKTAVASLGEAKIFGGDPNGNFNPTSPITRAEIAACLCRALGYAN